MRSGVLSGVVLFGLICAAGCETDCNTVEPAYAGDSTDEAWRALIDGRAGADDDSDDAPTFSAPDDGGTFDGDDAPTFSWDSPLKVAMGAPKSSAQGIRRRPLAPFEHLSRLVIPVAHAHLPPITSDVYLLEVDVPGRACPVAGITTDLSFSFPSSDWEAIVAGGGARSARLLSAFLTENRITEGAFISPPLSFDVEE
jgi:hypothetical protein